VRLVRRIIKGWFFVTMAVMSKPKTPQSKWIRAERRWTREELAWLCSEEGRSVCTAMASGERADTPAGVVHWREKLEPWKVSAAWSQVELRLNGRSKFRQAENMLFDRVGLEQATDEIIAMHKARRFAELVRSGELKDIADLCCGIGGDTIALAGVGKTIAVDRSRIRVMMAEHNAAVYGHEVTGMVNDVELHRPMTEAAHIDPDRRAGGPRRHQLAQSSPGPELIEKIVTEYKGTAIKLSPGVHFEEIPTFGELELISHQGQCKQAVLWTGNLARTYRKATVLPGGESIDAASEEEMVWPEARSIDPGCYLYEPDAAVIRADLVGVLARRYDLSPIDEKIVYLAGEQRVESSLMKGFEVIDMMRWSAKKARKWLADHDIGKVDIKTRGFAAKPPDIRKHFRLKGNNQAILFVTRIGEKPFAILATRLEQNQTPFRCSH